MARTRRILIALPLLRRSGGSPERESIIRLRLHHALLIMTVLPLVTQLGCARMLETCSDGAWIGDLIANLPGAATGCLAGASAAIELFHALPHSSSKDPSMPTSTPTMPTPHPDTPTKSPDAPTPSLLAAPVPEPLDTTTLPSMTLNGHTP